MCKIADIDKHLLNKAELYKVWYYPICIEDRILAALSATSKSCYIVDYRKSIAKYRFDMFKHMENDDRAYRSVVKSSILGNADRLDIGLLSSEECNNVIKENVKVIGKFCSKMSEMKLINELYNICAK